MTVEQLVSASRSAMVNGRNAMRQLKRDTAVEHYREALRLRLEAVTLDPGHADPGWLQDLQNSRGQVMRDRRYDAKVSASLIHDQMLSYLRQQIGEEARPQPVVLPVDNERVKVPTEWRVTTPGEFLDEEKNPIPCAHAFELSAADRRSCAVCGEVQWLVETMTLEQTKAHQQMLKEGA